MKILDYIFKNNKVSCSEELNILDIDDNFFYSLDGYISLYINVTPISFEYLSKVEKQRVIKRLINEISGEKDIIKIIVMSLPVETKDINNFLEKIRNKTQNSFKRRKLNEMSEEINQLSYKGEMLEKQIYIQIFQRNENNAKNILEKRGKELVLKLQNSGLDSYILDKHEILQFFNSFLNMKFKREYFNNVWSDEFE